MNLNLKIFGEQFSVIHTNYIFGLFSVIFESVQKSLQDTIAIEV